MANIPKLRTHQKKWSQTKKTRFPQFPPTSPSTLNPNQFHSVLSQWTTSLLDCQWTRSAVTMTFQIYRSVGTSDLHLGPRTQISKSLNGQIFRSSFGGHTYTPTMIASTRLEETIPEGVALFQAACFNTFSNEDAHNEIGMMWIEEGSKYKHFKKI